MQKLTLLETVKGGLQFEAERFRDPDTCFFPVYWWLWNTKIEKDELKKQIDEMLAADIKGFMIVAEHPEFDPQIFTELSPAYLSDAFMELVKYAVDYGVSKGMMIWLYDEAGWPSGSAGGLVTKENPALGRKQIAVRQVELEAGTAYQPQEDCLASFVAGRRIEAGYMSGEKMSVEEYYLKISSDFLPDLAEPAAVDRFIELTHERYRAYLGDYLGNAIQLMFTDEPANGSPVFTYDFAQRFSKTYGYDILDHLPVILRDEGRDDRENAIRADYYTLCGELFRDCLLKKQHDWCEKNGILSGGHMGGEHDPRYNQRTSRCNVVECLRQMTVPGVDAIWNQISMGKRTDRLTIGPCASEDMCIPFFPRFASSAARMNGTNLAFSESFAVYGSGLTFDEMRYVINYQTVRGINLYNFMNISYARDRFYAYSQRPSFGAEKPGYENLRAINQYTARLSFVNSIGKGCVDTAVYLSDRDLHAGGGTAQQACQAFYEIGLQLEKQGVDFDIIEDYGLTEAECLEDGLRIGQAIYRHIYIPENRYMPKELREKAAPYQSEGAPVCESSAGFEQLKASKRITENGEELYFLYNESNRPLQTAVSFTGSQKHSYELDLQSGELYAFDTAKIVLSLEPGESRTYLFTDAEYASDEQMQMQPGIELQHFEATAVKAFVLNEKGGYAEPCEEYWKPIPLGSWKEQYGEAFSGDVLYRTQVHLEETPERPLLLELGKVEHSARVYINGTFAGIAAMSPKQVKVKPQLFRKGENRIDILVSNTAANQFVLSDAQYLYSPAELSLFHPISLEAEKKHLDGGLYGPVILR